MVTNRSDEYRTFGTFGKPVAFPKRRGVLWRPPEIEVAALAASQARASPAPVFAIRGFVMKPPRVHGQPLHHVGGAPPDRRITLLREPLQEFLMAEDRVGGSAGFKHLAETESLLGIHQSQSPINYSSIRSKFIRQRRQGGVKPRSFFWDLMLISGFDGTAESNRHTRRCLPDE